MKLVKLCLWGIFSFAMIVSLSCQKSDEQIESEFLSNAVDQFKIDNNIHWVVVLPGLGCHGCIQVAEAFMRDHIKNTKIIFILTNISSLKILQQKTGFKIEDHSNIIVDRENIFKVPTKNGIYPCIIQLDDGKIINFEFQSPQNGNAFEKLNAIFTIN